MKGCWLKAILGGVLVVLIIFAAVLINFWLNLTLVTPTADSGFHWPYYLYIPDQVERQANNGEAVHILVLPNNSRTTDDNFDFHQRDALFTTFLAQLVFRDLDVVFLMPVFPRSETNMLVYTHALDRDVMVTDIPELHRLDLQLEAMIDDAAGRLSQQGWRIKPKVLLWGFSASGMFVNRFTLLHPDRVQAAVIGSPGGWPIAPVKTWQGECLRYPIGVCDLEELVGEDFDVEHYRQVPQFFFLGGQDENDSVPYRDSYEEEDEILVFRLFGETPVERWPIAEEIYKSIDANAEFHTYPGIGHRPAAIAETIEFFSNQMQSD
jgi:pimeloyl-ACP methyl ester carboxylesterase